MDKLIYFFILLFTYSQADYGQALHIDSTRFITGYEPGTSIRFAIPTADNGILFVGGELGNPGGIIPYFPIDTGVNGNVLIGKIDSNQKISWIKIYGGTDEDFAVSACQTSDGGYAVLAQTFSNNGDITGFLGGADIWLLRIDATGNLLWEKCYGSPYDDAPISIANTPDNGLIIFGASDGSGNNVPSHYGALYSFDWLVIKTDSFGSVLWSKALGTSNDEGQTGAILSIDSCYYLISNTGSYDHDCTDTAWHNGVATGVDLYILKLDVTGHVLWDKSYGGTQTDGANCAIYDTRDSTIVINGFTYSSNYMVTGYHGEGDMWVIKVNKDGNLLWQKALGTTQEEIGTGICAAHNNGYVIYGTTFPYLYPDTTIGDIGAQDCWIFSLDNFGNENTNKVFGGNLPDYSKSIVPYLDGYAATGLTGSKSFTQGTTYGNFDTSVLNPDGGGAFISYIDSTTLGVKNNFNVGNKDIIVLPNPANEYIKIILSNKETGDLTIINDVGQIIIKEQISEPISSIDLQITQWSYGIYFIYWNDANGFIQTAKFIKM